MSVKCEHCESKATHFFRQCIQEEDSTVLQLQDEKFGRVRWIAGARMQTCPAHQPSLEWRYQVLPGCEYLLEKMRTQEFKPVG